MADATRRPRVGVTGPRRGAWGPRCCVHVALRLAGGVPAHLRPGDPVDVSGLDAVVITGGHDVEPVLYQAVAEVEGRYDPERDAFESALLGEAIARRRPVLAICRGAQLLNVHLGGSLLQDLRARRTRTRGRRTILPLERVRVDRTSLLGRVLGREELKVNSLHDQAIDRLGDGLHVSAVDRDEIVQGVEHPQHDFVVGVQWHPEFLFCMPDQLRLFRRLVASAARHGESRDGEVG